jgi:hypothetical protein
MNPDTNGLEPLAVSITCLKCGKQNQPHYVKCLGCGEPLQKYLDSFSSGKEDALASQIMKFAKLVRPDGSEVPKHWAIFQVGEYGSQRLHIQDCLYE